MNKILPIILVVVLSGCSKNCSNFRNHYSKDCFTTKTSSHNYGDLNYCMKLDCGLQHLLCQDLSDDDCRFAIQRYNLSMYQGEVKLQHSSQSYTHLPKKSINDSARKKRIKEYGKILDDAQDRAIIREMLKYAPKEDKSYRGDIFDTDPDSHPNLGVGGDVW